MVRGWNVARFAYVRAQIIQSHDAETASLRRWIGTPGVTEAALKASLRSMTDATDIEGARRRESGLAAIIAARPLSAENWLAIAGMRLVTGEPYQQVLDALAMSSVTGPNEGAVMWQRGIFGVLQWENLPQSARKRTISDLAGAVLGTSPNDGEFLSAKNILRGKPPLTREDVADLMRAEGVPPSALGRMGL